MDTIQLVRGADDVVCPECSSKMVLRSTTNSQSHPGKLRYFYGCTNYPNCRATHGAHPDGAPMGVPGDRRVRAARRAAHLEFDELWKSGKMKRKEAYQLLWDTIGYPVHFSEVGVLGCQIIIDVVKKLKEQLNVKL